MNCGSGRALIERELMRRIERNPRYSLRAFAKALGVSHTALSLVMAGRRNPSTKLMTRFADQIGLAPDEKARVVRGATRQATPEVRPIDLDLFTLIADWNHYAVLSLLELPGARFEAKWIAQRLSIPQLQAKAVMDRLVRLGMVSEKDGVMRQTSAPLRVENNISTPATRRFHQGLLAKALESLENDPIEARDFSSMTFAMDESLIPYAKEKIRAFRRKLVAELERKGAPTRVFNLTVQIYPVSH